MWLKGSLYGTSPTKESIVDIDEVDPDESNRTGSIGVGRSICEGVAVSGELDRLVAIGVKLKRSLDPFCSCALPKVFRMVGLVADNVSNRRLVAFLPYAVGAILVVSSDNLGRFEGEGEVAGKSCWLLYVVTGDEGKTARDILRVYGSGSGGGGGGGCCMKASMIFVLCEGGVCKVNRLTIGNGFKVGRSLLGGDVRVRLPCGWRR